MVDFPEPDRPTRATFLPAGINKFKFSSTLLLSYEKLYHRGRLGKIGNERYNTFLKKYKSKGYKDSKDREYLKYEEKE